MFLSIIDIFTLLLYVLTMSRNRKSKLIEVETVKSSSVTPMSEAVRVSYLKSLGFTSSQIHTATNEKSKTVAKKRKRKSFASRNPKLYDSSILAKLKERIICKYGNYCMSCGETSNIVLDHIKARYCGGTNRITNLQLLCKSCNFSKGLKTIDFRPKKPQF